MKTRLCFFLILFLLSSIGLVYATAADTSGKTQISLPWDEFKKIIRLDENQVILSMEIYHKLLAQTGVEVEAQPVVRDGYVMLTRAQFDRLVEQMKPPQGTTAAPPVDFLVTRAAYAGVMGQENVRFTATFNVAVLKRDAFLKVPLLPQSIALEDIKVNNKAAMVVRENGYHHIIFNQKGDYTATAVFSIRSSLEKGPHLLDIPIIETPITLLQLKIPLTNIKVDIPQAQQLRTQITAGRTDIYATLTSGRSIRVEWRKKVAPAERVAAKVYSEVLHLVSIEEDVLKVDTDIHYNILHSEINQVRVVVPRYLTVLSVTGAAVGDWRESMSGDERVLVIPFNYGAKGTVTVAIASEMPLSESGRNVFDGIKTLETVRETGYIGIALHTSAEVKVAESDGLEITAIQKLPAALYNKSDKPLMRGLRYLKHPFRVVLEIRKHEKMAVPMATIHSANAVTLFTEDGKVVHRLIYQVRNSSKQFLQMRLPRGADVWSVFVDNKPVESSINGDGDLLIPLIRSQMTDNRLQTFAVEVIYCLVEGRFSAWSRKESNLPQVDLLTSQIIWSVYLPNDYRYFYFQSTLEKEEIIRGINIFGRAWRQYDEEGMKRLSAADQPESRNKYYEDAYKGKDYKSRFRNVPLKEEQLSTQVQSELDFSGRLNELAQGAMPATQPSTGATGITPIQIDVPTSGQVYRFAKTIVKSDDALTFSVVYAQNYLVSLARWLVILLILILLYGLRKKIKNFIHRTVGIIEEYRAGIVKIIGSRLTLIILIGFLLVSMFIGRALFLLIFVLLWIVAGYQIVEYSRRSKEK
ncbi:hypothetical protein JXO59_04120 [candidate division KSB1 bacterium]|nr:hypothetical protein [candidate division KSB1 bacterium]